MKKICLWSLCLFLSIVSLLATQKRTIASSKITYEGAYQFSARNSAGPDEELSYVIESGTLVTVELLSDIDTDSIKEHYMNQYDIAYSDLANEALKMYRQDVLAYYTQIRLAFKERNNILKDFYIDENISSPFVFLQIEESYEHFSIEELANKIANDEYVSSISIIRVFTTKEIKKDSTFVSIMPTENAPMSTPDPDPNTYFSNILNVINANEALLNMYNGTGVTVGIFEPSQNLPEYGIIDGDAPAFIGRSVERDLDKLSPQEFDNHATFVGSIAVGNYGVARNARILTNDWDASIFLGTFLYGSIMNESNLQWFVNEGANIINMSFGLHTNHYPIDLNQYDKISQFYDKFVYQNSIVLVAAAGNDGPSQLVDTPASGYNVIAVGATNPQGNQLASNSSYAEISSIEKPNLVAPGDMMIPVAAESMAYYDGAHTSFSAPLVTGAIALAMQKSQSLKFDPRKVIALVTATANKHVFPISEYNDLTLGYENRIGAGLLDVKKLLDNVNNVKNFEFILSVNPISITVYEQQIKANALQPVHVKIALFWYSQIYEQTRYTSKIKIQVYYNEILQHESALNHGNNTEIVYLNRLQTNGLLKIIVTRYQIVGSPHDKGSVAYWISPQSSGGGGGGGFPPPEEVYRNPNVEND